MNVHHLNAATLCPVGMRLINGSGSLFKRARMVCHVLAIETGDGIVLVDTGLGTGDIADPKRLGTTWLWQLSPRLDAAETVAAQLRARGVARSEVRDIVLTHLDFDHAGGVADFPDARVHVHVREHAAATRLEEARPRGRYVGAHVAHGPRWKLFDDGGERWFGFDGVRALSERHPEILLVPLRGHTHGHTGVAVRSGDRWVLHAGDAYFFHRQVETPPNAPLALRFFQRRGDVDRAARQANQERLRVLASAHAAEVTIVCSHDPVELDRAVLQETLAVRGPMATPDSLPL